jgi:DnaJ-domain-containing protein 1
MIWLSNSTLARLRDQLLESGRRPSTVATSAEAAEGQRLHAEYGPLCEAMYLMMAADGEVSGDEREVLRGALRNLSSSALRSVDIETLLDLAVANVAAEGTEARLKAVASELGEDRGRGEVAFVLAAAIAFADNAIADGENETLSSLAEALGIDEDRAEALLDQVEKDLAADVLET